MIIQTKLRKYLKKEIEKEGIDLEDLKDFTVDHPHADKIESIIRRANMTSKMFSYRMIAEVIGISENSIHKILMKTSKRRRDKTLDAHLQIKQITREIVNWMIDRGQFTRADVGEAFGDHPDWIEATDRALARLRHKGRIRSSIVYTVNTNDDC